MITRDEFPYLRQLRINDCYAVRNLDVPISAEGEDFKHLILTGKNGSGKTTVLLALTEFIKYDSSHPQGVSEHLRNLRAWIKSGQSGSERVLGYQKELEQLTRLKPLFKSALAGYDGPLQRIGSGFIFTSFEAYRKVILRDVKTVTREDELSRHLEKTTDGKGGAELFKQYLVNKKVFQVFDVIEGKNEGAQQEARFFDDLEETLRRALEDPGLTLEFVREEFEFYLVLSDGRRITFNQLSAGFSAFLSVLTELLMRTDLLRKQVKDYTYNPCGFVLIDEPETHLHLELQYQMLPLLTGMFPNLQFIVATHSPAVASSITSATVFDLTTRKTLGDVAAGSAYSELMQGHFGVSNEYSNVADAILDDIRRIAKLPDHTQARRELMALLEEKGRYMSPFLRLEVEAQLISLEA